MAALRRDVWGCFMGTGWRCGCAGQATAFLCPPLGGTPVSVTTERDWRSKRRPVVFLPVWQTPVCLTLLSLCWAHNNQQLFMAEKGKTRWCYRNWKYVDSQSISEVQWKFLNLGTLMLSYDFPFLFLICLNFSLLSYFMPLYVSLILISGTKTVRLRLIGFFWTITAWNVNIMQLVHHVNNCNIDISSREMCKGKPNAKKYLNKTPLLTARRSCVSWCKSVL